MNLPRRRFSHMCGRSSAGPSQKVLVPRRGIERWTPTTVTRWHGLLIFGGVSLENPASHQFPRWFDHELTTNPIFTILYDEIRPRGDFHRCAVVAQLDRSFGSDPKGRRFESCQPHQKSTRLRYVGACFCCCMESVPARAALQPHHLPQLLLRFPLLLVERMGVNVQRCTGLGMTQQTGYRADIYPLSD